MVNILYRITRQWYITNFAPDTLRIMTPLKCFLTIQRHMCEHISTHYRQISTRVQCESTISLGACHSVYNAKK